MATKFSASGKDIATQQNKLAALNSKVEAKIRDFNSMSKLYNRIISKITSFHNDNIITLEGVERKLIQKKMKDLDT